MNWNELDFQTPKKCTQLSLVLLTYLQWFLLQSKWARKKSVCHSRCQCTERVEKAIEMQGLPMVSGQRLARAFLSHRGQIFRETATLVHRTVSAKAREDGSQGSVKPGHRKRGSGRLRDRKWVLLLAPANCDDLILHGMIETFLRPKKSRRFFQEISWWIL